MKKKLLWAGATLLLALTGGVTYWYVIVAGAPQWDGPQQALAQGSKLNFKLENYDSIAMGGERTYGVMLPPDYEQNPKKFYPVIFLLHGGHGSPSDWFQKAAAAPVIQQLYDQKKLPYSIIITPDGNDLRGSSAFFDSDYFDGPNGKVSTAVGLELVQTIEQRYRVQADRKFWAMGGLSSGGWGAINIGLHNVDRFSIMFSHSGYFSDRSGWQNSPIEYIKSLPKSQQQRLKIYLDAGSQDGDLLQQTKKFHKTLEKLKINHVFREFPGGHGIVGHTSGWNYWHLHLADSLTFVGSQFKIAELAQKKQKDKNTQDEKFRNSELKKQS